VIEKIDAWRTGGGATFLSEKEARAREVEESRQVDLEGKLAEVGLAKGDNVSSTIVAEFTIVDLWQWADSAKVRLRGVLARTEDEDYFYLDVELDEFLAQWGKTV